MNCHTKLKTQLSTYLACIVLGLLLSCSTESASPASNKLPNSRIDADVVILGATPAGIVAGVAAKRSGRSVIILEPSNELGGIIVGGLGASDTCRTQGIGSTAREFFIRVGKKYGHPIHWFVEPSVAKAVFQEMLDDTELEVIYQKQLLKVEKSGTNITTLHTVDGGKYRAKVFIDATYEGDLLAKSGVSYIVGRESRETYGETLAGVTDPIEPRNFNAPVSAYDDEGKLLPGVHLDKLPPVGSGDNKVMAFNYRVCVTRDPKNKVAFPEPSNYDPEQYELLARYFRAKPDLKLEHIIMGHHMRNGKICTNRTGPFSTNFVGESWTWAEADYKQREQIALRHKQYTLGLFHFLNNDESVPGHLRKNFSEFGLCKDEFVDNGNFPHLLYVREGRRMIGQYVLRESDLLENRFKDDGIGLASCPIEVHAVQRAARPNGTVTNEGVVGLRVKPYSIPYRSVIPKRSEVTNLLVPVAVSASQIAYSSMRMEPVFMILGHSTAVAASLAIEKDVAVQDIDVNELRALLRKHKQVL